MPNRNKEIEPSLPLAVRFAIKQAFKGINTCLPGLVLDYDRGTRRATVQPALSIMTTDGRFIPRAPVPNVPVVFPSGGGFSLSFPLHDGDPVLLVYSQRGLSGWKITHDQSPPDRISLFDAADAIAIPGFGPVGNDDPNHFISFEEAADGAPDTIRIKSSGRISLEAPEVLVNGESI